MLKLYEYIKRNFCYECQKSCECETCDVGKIRAEVVKRIDNDIKCANCRYFHKYKEFANSKYEFSSCCTVLPENEEGYDSFVLKVDPFGKCEMFARKVEE